MIDDVVNLMNELAVNPDAQISEAALNRYQISDGALRSALLNKDKQAVMRLLDSTGSARNVGDNSTIYSIPGDVEAAPSLPES